MNLRNTKLVLTIRILFGLFIIFSGVGGLMAGSSMSGVPQSMIPTMTVFWNTGIFHMIKITEVLAGLMLVIGFLPALASLALVPLSLGIIIFNAKVSPANLPMGFMVGLLTAYLGYVYWDKYRLLFTR